MAKEKEHAVMVGIAILFSIFVIVTIDAISPAPEYIDYCNDSWYPIYNKQLETDVNCTDVYRTDEADLCMMDGGNIRTSIDEDGCEEFERCDYCVREFDNARDAYDKTVFSIIVPIGLIAIILGVLYKVGFIGSGFMFSGVFLLGYSTLRYFEVIGRFTRVVVIFVELLVILWIGYKKVLKNP